MLERFHSDPLLRWIVQFNNKVDVCGGLYPVDLAELVRNHFTWVFEPFQQQRMKGKTEGDEAQVTLTIRRVCDRLEDLLNGTAGTAPITAEPEILYKSPFGFVVADEKGDPNSRLVLAARGYTNLISLVCQRSNGRYTYSVIRGSPYDEDTFQVIKLIDAFQAAEDLPTAKIWGGSNLAAGSDSELGSSLHWTRIRDIAEAIVEETSRKVNRGRTSVGRSPFGILVVMDPAETAKIHGLLDECGIEAFTASSCAEAAHAIRAGVPMRAVFSALSLPDGGFWDLVRMASRCPEPTPVIVFLPQIDGGWIDLLESGAFDVVGEPYQREKIERILAAIPLYARAPREFRSSAGRAGSFAP
ncbi:MAG: response regulator [Bryobacteraceae bacterium]